jgi:hypothetical protein
MLRNPRVNLLLHTIPVRGEGSTYATVSGTVELTDDPYGSFHRVIYRLHMGGATPPRSPVPTAWSCGSRPNRCTCRHMGA